MFNELVILGIFCVLAGSRKSPAAVTSSDFRSGIGKYFPIL